MKVPPPVEVWNEGNLLVTGSSNRVRLLGCAAGQEKREGDGVTGGDVMESRG